MIHEDRYDVKEIFFPNNGDCTVSFYINGMTQLRNN